MEQFINKFIETSDIRRQKNIDAEFINGLKRMHLETQMRLREGRESERRKKFAEVVWEYCKEQKEIIQKKYNLKN